MRPPGRVGAATCRVSVLSVTGEPNAPDGESPSTRAAGIAAMREYADLGEAHEELQQRISAAQRQIAELHMEELRLRERARRLMGRLGGHDPLGLTADPAEPQKKRRRRGEVRALLLKALPGTVAEISAKTGINRDTVRVSLRALEQRRVVAREQPPPDTDGKRRDIIYRAGPSHSA